MKQLILLTIIEWRRRMGIEPTWDFVEPHRGFEDQERHQVALRLRESVSRGLRMAPQDSASTFSTRVTSGAVMEQMPGHFNMNTTIGKRRFRKVVGFVIPIYLAATG